MSQILDVTWSPSSVTEYLTCPRAWRLRHVDRVPRDHRVDGYASELGTAAHAVLADALVGHDLEAQDEVLALMQRSFANAVAEAIERGAEHDPDGVERAMQALEKLAVSVAAVANDPRLQAVDWRYVEEAFSWRDAEGRRYAAHPDAIGVVREHVRWSPDPDGMGWIELEPGQVVAVDWKTGEVELSRAGLALNVQLAWYAQIAGQVLELPRGAADVFAALGVVRDAEPPARPKDPATGEAIPRRLKALDPRFVEAHGGDAALAAASRKRPKDVLGAPIPKWVEQDNPAWEAARRRPRGPVLRMAWVDQAAAMQTVADVIHAAEAGLFPAAGAVNGACRRCRVRAHCVAHAGGWGDGEQADGDAGNAEEGGDAEGDAVETAGEQTGAENGED